MKTCNAKMIGYQDSQLNELIVDNFAGGGGASIGIELAIGRPVDIAVNHDEDAIAMHKVNHPYTTHYQENVFAIDPEKVTAGRPVGIAWFSPDCKHHSKAKGGKPVDRKIRGLSWVILKWAMSSVAPRVIFMENVEEIQTWGPLIQKNGKAYPDPTRKGETFNGFIAMLTTGIDRAHPAFEEACEFLKLNTESEEAEKLLKGLRYKVEFRVLKACDYGAPTIRKQFYLIARRDGLSIVWPKATHGKAEGMLPYRTAADCIDFSKECPSIFTRNKALAWKALRRIALGVDKFVLKNPRPFIMEMNYQNTAQDPLKPMTTQTTANHHYLIAPHITKFFSGRKQSGARVNDPVPTVTSIDHNGLVETHLCVLRNNMDCKPLDEQMPTLTTSAGHFAQVTTYLQKYSAEQPLRHWDKVRKLLNTYAGYSITEDEILILEINGVQHFIADIGMRMLKPEELKLAQGCPKDYIIDIESYIGKRYSKAKQVARLGNMVCPQVATALIRSNFADIACKRQLHTVAELNAVMCGSAG